jgi:hypothetical protein
MKSLSNKTVHHRTSIKIIPACIRECDIPPRGTDLIPLAYSLEWWNPRPTITTPLISRPSLISRPQVNFKSSPPILSWTPQFQTHQPISKPTRFPQFQSYKNAYTGCNPVNIYYNNISAIRNGLVVDGLLLLLLFEEEELLLLQWRSKEALQSF